MKNYLKIHNRLETLSEEAKDENYGKITTGFYPVDLMKKYLAITHHEVLEEFYDWFDKNVRSEQ